MSAEVCERIYVYCRDRALNLAVGDVVRSGTAVGGCEVVSCIPRECVVGGKTRVEYVRKLRVRREDLENNVALYVESDGGDPVVYVYPKKVFDEFVKMYVEPLRELRPPWSSGVLLTGPPGIGKSTLAWLAAEMYGIPYTRINFASLLSKWLGESEKNLDSILVWLMRSPPAMAIVDDAEILLTPRALASGREGGTAEAIRTMQNILFNRMQEMHTRRIPSLIVATTNVKESMIDQAFLRVGRFGDPIHIPLQDYEATYVILKHMLKDEARARELARRYVNAGLPLSDVVSLAAREAAGLSSEIRPKMGLGYKRLYLDPVGEFELLFDRSSGRPVEREGFLPRGVLSGSGRLRIVVGEDSRYSGSVSVDVGVALGAQLCYAAGRSVVYLMPTGHSEVDEAKEAAHAADATKSCLIAPCDAGTAALRYVHSTLDTPIVYVGPCGSMPLPAYSVSLRWLIDLLSAAMRTAGRVGRGYVPVLKAVLAYLGSRMEVDARKVEAAVDAVRSFECLLNVVISTRRLDDTTLDRAVKVCGS